MSYDAPTPSDDARQRRLAEIRRQIADGTYETPEKLASAVEHLLQRIRAMPVKSNPAALPRPQFLNRGR